eukprot:Sspe_Gene.27380::Locus_11778_Transcript_2_8_Confidence_0.368_Length_516::g.27380::m.27380
MKEKKKRKEETSTPPQGDQRNERSRLVATLLCERALLEVFSKLPRWDLVKAAHCCRNWHSLITGTDLLSQRAFGPYHTHDAKGWAEHAVAGTALAPLMDRITITSFSAPAPTRKEVVDEFKLCEGKAWPTFQKQRSLAFRHPDLDGVCEISM